MQSRNEYGYGGIKFPDIKSLYGSGKHFIVPWVLFRNILPNPEGKRAMPISKTFIFNDPGLGTGIEFSGQT
jgi:hypothetical protein